MFIAVYLMLSYPVHPFVCIYMCVCVCVLSLYLLPIRYVFVTDYETSRFYVESAYLH